MLVTQIYNHSWGKLIGSFLNNCLLSIKVFGTAFAAWMKELVKGLSLGATHAVF